MLSCYTFKRRPVDLVFSQEFSTREQALSSEQQIKGWSRKKKEAMIRNDWAEVSRLARSATSIHAQPHAAVYESHTTAPVRPEPVEGRFANRTEPFSKAQENRVEVRRTVLSEGHCAPSVHPSTGSGRTEGDEA